MSLNEVAKKISDNELLEQFRNETTRESGFTLIVKKYSERLYWHIRRMVIEHEDANDVLQNVLIRVWNGLENFREDSQLYTWLYRIGFNCAVDLVRSRDRRDAAQSRRPLSARGACACRQSADTARGRCQGLARTSGPGARHACCLAAVRHGRTCCLVL